MTERRVNIPSGSMSVTKWSRQGQRTTFTPIVGLVERTTDAAVRFSSPELKAMNLPERLWLPRKAIDQGNAIVTGDAELSVADWFIDLKRSEAAAQQPVQPSLGEK